MTTATNPTGASSGRNGSTDGRAITAGGGIDRVHAFDGLFLRAEHLDRMQEYALDLTLALGVAGGPGVVHGFDVTIKGEEIHISPGLAIDQLGRPLKSDRMIRLSRANLKPIANEFLWVEICSAMWTYGSEAVQGLLCDDPCSGGSTADALQAEGVIGRLISASLQGLTDSGSDDRRNWLASRIFEKEQRHESPWTEDGGQASWPLSDTPPLANRDWRPKAAPQSASPYVRLAVLIPPQGTSGWQVDVWAARRERGDPNPVRHWQTQLGMRPWNVFIAQVLQFQDLLGVSVLSPESLQGRAYLDEVVRRVRDVQGYLQDPKMTKKASQEHLEKLVGEISAGSLGEGSESLAGRPSLPDSGVDELPPAGFLPVVTSGEELKDEVLTLLGGPERVGIRLCPAALSDLGGFLQQAQHRARIPLGGGTVQQLDIFVPTGDDSNNYDWVAFARREMLDCPREGTTTPTEPVDVYVLDEKKDYAPYAEWTKYLGDTAHAKPPPLPDNPDASLSYPAKTWALPEGAEAATMMKKLFDLLEFDREATAVAIVTESSRRALGATRASLLANRLAEDDVTMAEVRCLVQSGPESIVVLVSKTAP